MCGNFGLLMLSTSVPQGSVHVVGGSMSSYPEKKSTRVPDKMDRSLHRSMHEVARLRGNRVQGKGGMVTLDRTFSGHLVDERGEQRKATMLNPLEILSAQTSSTEVRGGQAGGISSFDHRKDGSVVVTRTRCVARKRYPLAADLVQYYEREAKTLPDKTSDVSIIGHTRFATSSVNLVSELHPHEWMPFRMEEVWGLDATGTK